MTETFEEEFNYLIELSGKVLIGQVDAEKFEENRVAFFEKYNTNQRQALPVVPEFVAEYIKTKLDKSKNLQDLYDEPLFHTGEAYLSGSEYNFISWFNENTTLFEKAWTNGYTVEKTKLFYLKHIDMSKHNDNVDYWFSKKGYEHVNTPKGSLPKNFGYLMGYGIGYLKFTQQEIDSMQTGSYEKIEVTE